MKKVWFLVVFASLLVLIIIGCNNSSYVNKGVEVTVEGNGQFPASLAGTWICKKRGLEIILEPDGMISAAALPIGLTLIKPGETTRINPDPNFNGVYQPGPWAVDYIPAKRELTIELSLERFYVELPDGVIRGDSRDIFTGKVSEDSNTWQAEWYTFPNFYITTDSYSDLPLPDDANDNPRAILIFRKEVTSP